MRHWTFTLAALLLAAVTGPLRAATHDVILTGTTFSPRQLTIQVGDTVRWTNQGGFHDVVADDGSFNSGDATTANFVFSQTFNQPGVFGYFCSIHGASGGIGMAGTITVEGTVSSAPAINRGINGSWFNPATDGQGFLVEAFPDAQIFTFAWFTWTDQGGYDWMTGLGSYTGNVAQVAINRSSGGRFNDPAPVTGQEVGSAVFTLQSCSEATFQFTLNDSARSGTIPLQRILPAGPECQPPASAPDAGQ